MPNGPPAMGRILAVWFVHLVLVGQDVTGQVNVEFDRDTSALAAGAKPIMLGVLSAAGMRIDDIEQWNFAASGKHVTMEGKLSTPALRKLLGIVQSPIPAATNRSQPSGSPQTNR